MIRDLLVPLFLLATLVGVSILVSEFRDKEVEHDSESGIAEIETRPDPAKSDPLFAAIRAGDHSAVEAALRAGADPNRPSDGTSAIKGHPPLLEAALIGNTDIIRVLLDAGAEIDAEYLGGHRVFHTALSYAAHNGNITSVRALLRAGADPGRLVCAYYHCGNSLTMAALSRDPDTVRAFIAETGAKPDVINLHGLDDAYAEMTNPKSYDRRFALLPPLHAAYMSGNREIVDLLLAAGADGSRLDSWGRRASEFVRPYPKMSIDEKVNALVAAVERDDVQQAAALLADDADPNIATMDGRAPLPLAVTAGNVEMVRTLLAGGADPERPPRREYGEHPLHIAIQSGHGEVVQVLLEHGADLNAIYDDEASEKHTALGDAIAYGHTEIALMLIERGADTDAGYSKFESWEGSYLSLAALKGNEALVRRLIAEGNEVSPQLTMTSREVYASVTPLIAAVWGNHPDIVALLLQEGADVSTKNNYGCSAYDFAVIKKYDEAAALLRNAGGVADEAGCDMYRYR